MNNKVGRNVSDLECHIIKRCIDLYTICCYNRLCANFYYLNPVDSSLGPNFDTRRRAC